MPRLDLAGVFAGGDLLDWADEAFAAAKEVVRDGEGHDADKDWGGPVHVDGGDGQDGGKGEEDDEEEAEEEGEDVDGHAEAAHGPRPELDRVRVGAAPHREHRDRQRI